MPFLSHHLLLQIKERETKQQEMRLIGGTGISRLVFLVLFTSCLHQARASSMVSEKQFLSHPSLTSNYTDPTKHYYYCIKTQS